MMVNQTQCFILLIIKVKRLVSQYIDGFYDKQLT